MSIPDHQEEEKSEPVIEANEEPSENSESDEAVKSDTEDVEPVEKFGFTFGCTKCDQTFSLVEELEQHLHTHADGEELVTGMLTITYF